MSGPDKVLFAWPYRGELWRFTRSSYGGTPHLNVRAFWQSDDGEWRPCSGRSGKGFTMPLEVVQRLGEALTNASRQIGDSGAPMGATTVK
jgi:hypothetical protein